jgi:alkylation response protein AidB-like acyl-CoA dehydrogenase
MHSEQSEAEGGKAMTATTGLERETLREAVASITPVIEAHRDEGERERRLSPAIVAAMREAGLFKLWTPKEYGGDEVDLPTFMAAVEEISRIDGASGWVFANLAAGGMFGAFLPPEGAKEIYSNGPNVALAGSGSPTGRAIPVDGGYRVSGRWPLSSGCHYGDGIGGVALIFDGDAPRMLPNGVPDLLSVGFRPEDCQILDTWDSLGLRGTGSADFVVNDVFVPEQLTFPFITGTPRVSGALYRAGILPLYSFAIAVVLPGIARAGIDAFVELAKGKTPTMSQTGLATRPTIHAEVAKAEALVQSARAFLYEVAGETMSTVMSGNHVSEDLEARRRLACVNIGESCARAVDALFTLAGSTPVYSGHRLERCLRDIRTAAQHLFVSPVWWEKTGQYYFGQGLGMP